MGREVRRLPADWQHPKDAFGRLIPLYGGSFSKAAAEWDEEASQWERGFTLDYAKWPSERAYKPKEGSALEYASFTDWSGERPVEADFMPDWPEDQRTHLMMYEDTSEGTPLSPAFETPEELALWLADNGASSFGHDTATYEQWLPTCRGGWAPSMVMEGGHIRSGVKFVADTGAA